MLIGGGSYKGEEVSSERVHLIGGQVYITGVEGMRACCRAHPEAAAAAAAVYNKRPDKAYCLFCKCLVVIDGHAARCGPANGVAKGQANDYHNVDRAFLGDAEHKLHMRQYMLVVLNTHAGEDQLTSNAHMRMYLASAAMSGYVERAQLSPGNSDWTWGTVFENFYWSDVKFRELYWGMFDRQYKGMSELDRVCQWRSELERKNFPHGVPEFCRELCSEDDSEDTVTSVSDESDPLLGKVQVKHRRKRDVLCGVLRLCLCGVYGSRWCFGKADFLDD